MKLHNVEQGTVEWLTLRLGIPTASQFSNIIQPKKLKYSESASKYRDRLLAEWCMGYPIEDGNESGAMMRGTDMEAEARAWYELHIDTDVQKVGFVTRDDGRVGGSPDGLVGDDGGVDFKCPMLHTHIGYLLGEEPPYAAQCQGYMYLTGRHWWDIASYHPALPRKIVHIERDDNFIFWLHRGVERFLRELEAGKRKLLELGYTPPGWVKLPEPTEPDPEAMTDAELDKFADDVRGSNLSPLRIGELLGFVIVGDWKRARDGWDDVRCGRAAA